MKAGKTGIYTTAVALVAVGVFIVLNVTGLVSFEMLRYLGPALIVLFGLEIIWHWYTYKDAPLRFSGWSLALILVVILFSLGQLTYMEPVQGQVSVNSDVRGVDIEVANARVTVTGTASPTVSYDGEVAVGASSRSGADKAIQSRWTVRQSGDILQLTLQRDWLPGIPIPPLSPGFPADSYLNVQVPQGLLTRLVTSNEPVNVSRMKAGSSIETSNGSVTVEQVYRDVDSVTSNAPVSLNDIKGVVKVRTSNCSVTVRDLQGDIQAKTTNATVSLNDISGRVQAYTINSSITGKSAVGGDWTLVTTNGAIALAVGPDASVKIKAATRNGKIGGDVPWLFDAKGHGLAVLGAGDHRIDLKTSNAGVTVNQ